MVKLMTISFVNYVDIVDIAYAILAAIYADRCFVALLVYTCCTRQNVVQLTQLSQFITLN